MLAQYGGPDDATALIEYLKPKPTGATVAEAKKTIGAGFVDARKLTALQDWNIIQVDGNRLTLTAPAREVAREPGKLVDIFLDALKKEPAYRGALEWAHFQKLDRLDQHELGAYWHEHYNSALGTDVEKAIARACSAFFRVASAAGLGAYVLGRRGAPTRLDIDRVALKAFVENTPVPLAPAATEVSDDEDEGDQHTDDGDERSEEDIVTETLGLGGPTDQQQQPPEETLKVFLSHGKNMDLVEQVATILDLAEVPYEIAVEEETTAIPVPEKVLASMRRCTAGVIIVSVDDTAATTPSVNENVLIETGAAFVLYDRRVILVWDKRLPVPSNLQGLYRCEFEGDELGWGSAVKLMKTLRGFKS